MKRKTAVICLIAGIAALTGILIWGIAGVPHAASAKGYMPWEPANTEVFFEEVPAAGIDAIETDLSMQNLRIVPDDRDTIRVVQYAPRGELDNRYLIRTDRSGSTLRVTAPGGNVMGWFWNVIPSMRVEITVPRGYTGSILAGTSSGDVELNAVCASVVRIETTSGEASAENLEVQELSARTTSGGADLRGIDAKNITVQTTSGDVFLTEARADSITTDSTSGDGFLVNVHAGTLQCSASSGCISIDGESEADAADISTTSGDTDCSFASLGEYRRTASSGTTSLSVADAARLTGIFVEATSGDVYIDLPDGTAVHADLSPTSGSTYTGGRGALTMSDQGIPVNVSTTSGSITLEAP